MCRLVGGLRKAANKWNIPAGAPSPGVKRKRKTRGPEQALEGQGPSKSPPLALPGWNFAPILAADAMDYFKSIPDFEGQHAAEKFSRIIITLFGIVGLIWGYAIQQFSQTVYILASGFFLASILTIPPWPMYRRKPLNWQPAREGDAASTTKSKKKK
ncbi:hypothetical protein YQE_03436, partial [Dendroctonus ponderosae]